MTRIIFDDGVTQIYCRNLTSALKRNELRNKERENTLALVRHVFGENAVYSHRNDGSPVIENVWTDKSISVSHGAGKVLLAVSSAPAIGVDIEAPRRQLLRTASKFMEKEWNSLSDLLRAWTIKEAVYKAALTPGLPLVEIPAETGEIAVAGFKFNVRVFEDADHTIAVAIRL